MLTLSFLSVRAKSRNCRTPSKGEGMDSQAEEQELEDEDRNRGPEGEALSPCQWCVIIVDCARAAELTVCWQIVPNCAGGPWP